MRLPAKHAGPSPRTPSNHMVVARQRPVRAQANETTTAAFDIKAKIQFLQEDLQHLFDERGIDPTAYEPVVDFVDPITKYASLEGYLFNIKFLKKAFDPKFFLHDSWASSDTAVTTRWTMVMEFTLTKGLPGIGKFFKPTIIFTGTSTYVFNPASGKIFRHIDTWDSIEDQKFFSFEGFLDFLKQLFQPYSTPSLETPEYVVLKRTKDYQIRRYEPFLVAECREDRPEESSSSSSSNGSSGGAGQAGSANPGMRAFQTLAGYIFGRNQRGEVMKMTTPVFNDSQGVMRFVIGPSAHQDLDALPAPVSPLVTTGLRPGRICAVRTFNGTVTPKSSEPELQALRQSLARDGLQPAAAADWTLARYNDPGTPSFFRRNEVLVPLDEAAFLATWP